MLIGHEKHIAALVAMRKSDGFPHAFLVTGASGVGKRSFAFSTTRWLQGDGDFAAYREGDETPHADIIYLRAPNIKEVRALRTVVARAPYSASTRSVIIEDAHELGAEAANALLKTLEEPRSRTVFFLLAENASRVLPTIASRCYHMPLGLVKGDYQVPVALSILADGRPQRAIAFSGNTPSAAVAHEVVRDAKQFIGGTLNTRFALIERYTQEDAPFALFFEALMGVIRAENGLSAGKVALKALLDISRRLHTGNASPAWMLRSFAVQIYSPKA